MNATMVLVSLALLEKLVEGGEGGKGLSHEPTFKIFELR